MITQLKRKIKEGAIRALKLQNQVQTNAYEDQKRLVPDAKIIFDLGANNGYTTNAYINKYPDAKIYGFEPYKEVFEEYKHRFKDNKNIIPLELALSNEIGEKEFFVNNNSFTNSLLPAEDFDKRACHGVDEQIGNKEITKVKTHTIDKFCLTNGIDKIDILKMDIQGGELDALVGSEKMLDNKKVDLLYIEIEFVKIYKDQPLFHDIASFLDKKDYPLYNIYNIYRDKKGRLIAGDAIFMKSSLFNN